MWLWPHLREMPAIEAGSLVRVKLRILFFLGVVAMLSACAATLQNAVPDAGYRTYSSEKRHHIAGGYQNVGDYRPSVGAGWRHLISDPYSKEHPVPARRVLNRAQIKQQLAKASRKPFSVTWIGHSTLLIKAGDRWILTDPMFGERASPLRNVGPKRSVTAALKVEDLPPIDVIIVSHNHYDHLDSRALRQLAKINPGTAVLMPLGNGGTAKRAGFRDVRELDWYDDTKIGDVKFTLVPAVHSSRRGFFNINKALWGGWSISARGKKIYFSGDTGFGSFIRDIRHHLGKHDIALVPIGAYHPPEVESGFHTTPEEAVKMGEILGARHIIPIHWGTIALTEEPFAEQRSRFVNAIGRNKSAHILKIGQSIGFY